MLDVFVPGEPIPQGSKNAYVRGKRVALVEANPRLPAWRQTVTLHLRKHAGEYAGEQALVLWADFYLPRPKSVRRWLPCVKPDLDKLTRAVNDSISAAGVWDDDSRATIHITAKHYADPPQPPGAHIRIAHAEHLKITITERET